MTIAKIYLINRIYKTLTYDKILLFSLAVKKNPTWGKVMR